MKPTARKDDLVIQELDGETLVYDLRANKALCLNKTSALIWSACDGNKTVSEIKNTISKKLDSSVSDDLIWLALDQLKKEKLITNGEEIVSKFNGLSRREVIKKVGLASLVALPIVASLVAPPAALAAPSCGTMCGSDNQCTLTQCSMCSGSGQDMVCSASFASEDVQIYKN